ncbi:MAG TPA: hypothetical protein VLC98_05290 [Phnomibacter sp.]|nr:hypothetical protein [Phnomibacter sp.]
MKILKLILPLFIMSFFSLQCKSKTEARFLIVNSSRADIDSLIIYPNDKIFVTLKEGDSLTYYSNMTNLPKVDGAYLLSFKQKNTAQLKNYVFGYYSNGFPVEKETRIEILTDTFLINQYYGNY